MGAQRFFATDDRTGYQQWEKEDKKRIIGKSLFGYTATEDNYQKVEIKQGNRQKIKI